MGTRVLIVDDSTFMCKRIQQVLQEQGEFEVLGFAHDGHEAVQMVHQFKPDVITMDIEMPRMDGISAVKQIMQESPTPILMFSASTHMGAKATLDALQAGAIDFLPKSLDDINNDRETAKKLLRMSVRTAAQQAEKLKVKRAQSHVDTVRNDTHRSARTTSHEHFDLVLVAASTGGPIAMQTILRTLSKDCSFPVLLIQHMPHSFTESFAERLNDICNVEVKLAEEGDVLDAGTAYLAPGGMQMEISGRKGQYKIHLRLKQPKEVYAPCVDITFNSVAQYVNGKILAVVLTGMGTDGKAGAERLKQQKLARIWAQDEASSTIYGMPKAIGDAGLADHIMSLDQIADKFQKLS